MLQKFLLTMLLKIAIVEGAQVEFDVAVVQVVDFENWSRDFEDVEANKHADVANDDVDIFMAVALDVVSVGS